MDYVENVSFIIAVFSHCCLFAELLLSNGCCIAACFAVVAYKQVYMPQYEPVLYHTSPILHLGHELKFHKNKF
jgi:hypothetical protein